jgi:NADH-quinone oxidoreductase subunit G
LDKKLPYDNLTELREALFGKFDHLRHIGLIADKSFGTVSKVKLNNNDFKNIINDFYLTNPIARASEVMAELSSGTRSKEINVAAE